VASPPANVCPGSGVVDDVSWLRRRPVSVGLVPVVVAAVLAGCSSGSHPSSNAQVTSAALPTRTCGTGVSGALQRGWRSSTIRAGSVWIYFWGAVRNGGHTGVLPASRFAAVSPGEFNGWKTMVIVPAGHSVIVRVASASLPRLRLAFQLPESAPSRLAEGQVADRFVPCSSGRTYFNGGLIVAGAQCARLEVSGRTATPVRLVVALGRHHCA
jgi:hypothetical protein